jgi:hypothetical protein
MCVLPDMNCFAVATSDHDLIFYDINAHVYQGSIVINEFPASLTAVDYHMSIVNSSRVSTLFCGDAQGNVFIFQGKDSLRPMFHISDRTNTMNNGVVRVFSLSKIIHDEYSTVSAIVFCHLHSDAVKQIRWIDDLDLFISCASTSTKSLFIGDLTRKTQRYIMTRKGVTAFDYYQV